MKNFTNVNEIQDWLEFHNIKKYSIDDNLIVNVDGDVILEKRNIHYFPFQFGIVDGVFDCSHNELTSLWGSPKEVKYGFNFSYNKLKSLEHTPLIVNGTYDAHNNEIENLDFLPIRFESLNLKNNKLTSLKGLPDIINGFLDVSNNQLTTFDATTKKINGFFDCSKNKIHTLDNFPDVEVILILTNNNLKLEDIYQLKNSFSTIYLEHLYFEDIANNLDIKLNYSKGECLIPYKTFKYLCLEQQLISKDNSKTFKI